MKKFLAAALCLLALNTQAADRWYKVSRNKEYGVTMYVDKRSITVDQNGARQTWMYLKFDKPESGVIGEPFDSLQSHVTVNCAKKTYLRDSIVARLGSLYVGGGEIKPKVVWPVEGSLDWAAVTLICVVDR